MKVLFICMVLFSISFSQEKDSQKDFREIVSRYGFEVYRPPLVGFNYFYNYAGAGSSKFQIAVTIQNDFLQFLKKEKFVSNYQVSLAIKSEKKMILSKTWKEHLELDEFQTTNSFRDYQYKSYSIDLADFQIEAFKPGEFQIYIELLDLQSSGQYKNMRPMKITEKDSLSEFLSSVAFLVNDSGSANNLNIITMNDHLDFNTPYTVLIRYSSTSLKEVSARVRLYYKNGEENILLDQAQYDELPSEKEFSYIKYALPYQQMEEGEYSIRFSIDADTSYYETEKEFKVLWLWKPLYLYKVDLAVRPMKYLLNEEEMEKVKAYDLDSLKVWFNNYWKVQDPTPGTVFNEKQDFYFKRVSEAVRSYSTGHEEGWQTDFGKILILYGEPNEIENKKYSINSPPHIVWKYVFDGETYEFKFMDEKKTGVYKLVE